MKNIKKIISVILLSCTLIVGSFSSCLCAHATVLTALGMTALSSLVGTVVSRGVDSAITYVFGSGDCAKDYYTGNTSTSYSTINYNNNDYDVTYNQHYSSTTRTYAPNYYSNSNNTYYTYDTTNNTYNQNTNNYYTSNHTVNNAYSTYYTTNNTSNDYYVNNYTYYTHIHYDYDSYQITVDDYFYKLPDGRNSYNLTADDVYGIYFSYNAYDYSIATTDTDILGIFHLDGTNANSVTSYSSTCYLSNTGSDYIDGKYDGCLRWGGAVDDMTLTIPSNVTSYTVAYWLYNGDSTYNAHGMISGVGWNWYTHVYRSDGTHATYINGVLASDTATYGNKQNIALQYASQTKYDNIYTDYDTIGSYTYDAVGTTFTYSNYFDYSRSYTIPIGNLNANTIGSKAFNGTYYYYQSSRNGTGGSGYYGYDHTGYRKIITGTTVVYDTSYVYNNIVNYAPCHSVPVMNASTFTFNHSGTGSVLNIRKYNYQNTISLVTSPVALETSTNTEGGVTFTSRYYRYNYSSYSTSVDTPVISSTSSAFCLSNNAVDEIIVCAGDKTELRNVPSVPYEFGYIYVAPSGSDYEIGDIGILGVCSATDVRVGGARPTFPSTGFVYVQVDGDNRYYNALQYDGSQWQDIEISVYDGNVWVSAELFDFGSISFYGSDDVESVGDTYNYYITDNDTINSTNIYDTFQNIKDYSSLAVSAFGWVSAMVSGLTILPFGVGILLALLITILPILVIIKIVKR